MLKETGFSVSQAIKFVDSFIKIIDETLVRGEKIQIRGFGSFDVGGRKAHTGTHPLTGQKTEMPEIATARFHPSESLKRMAK